MVTIAEAVVREIEERRGRCAGRPDQELIEHLLVAVQRERVAALASPIYASLSRQGALFTAPMDEKELPPIGETRMLAAARCVSCSESIRDDP